MNNKEVLKYTAIVGTTAAMTVAGLKGFDRYVDVKFGDKYAVPSPEASKTVEVTEEQSTVLSNKLTAEIDGAKYTVVPSVPTVKAEATVPTVKKVEPTATATAKPELKGGQFKVEGLPAKVEAANVLAAHGADGYGNTFNNSIGNGTEMIFADPGVLKVGPEFPEEQLKALGKSGERFNPSNQAVIQTETGSWSVREGGFTIINGNDLTFEVAGNDKAKPFKVTLGGDEVNHTIVAIRGLFPDSKTPADRNRTVKVTQHPAAHTMFDSYPLGAYISEGHIKQVIANAFTSYPNNGDAGAKVVRMFELDLNTGAYTFVEQNGLNGPWKTIARNW